MYHANTHLRNIEVATLITRIDLRVRSFLRDKRYVT
jgi:hypothetical protein